MGDSPYSFQRDSNSQVSGNVAKGSLTEPVGSGEWTRGGERGGRGGRGGQSGMAEVPNISKSSSYVLSGATYLLLWAVYSI